MAEAFRNAIDMKTVKHVDNGVNSIIEFVNSTTLYNSIVYTIASGCIKQPGSIVNAIFPSVRNIGTSTFFNCYNMRYASFSGAYVFRYAFGQCRKLDTLVFKGSVCTFGSRIDNNASIGGLYLLTNSKCMLQAGYSVTDAFSTVKSIYVTPSLYDSYIEDSAWAPASSIIYPYGGELNDSIS